MASVGALGIGLSIVFGVFLILLLAELYYLLFWKRKSLRLNSAVAPNDPSAGAAAPGGEQQLQSQTSLKMFESRFMVGIDGECVLAPPRLLFTIKEETREDIADSEDGSRMPRAAGNNHVVVQVFHDPALKSSGLEAGSSSGGSTDCSSARSSSSCSDEDEGIGGAAAAPGADEDPEEDVCTTPFLTPPSSPGFSTPSSSPLRSYPRSSSSSVSCYESPPSPPLAPMPVLPGGGPSPHFTPLSCSSRDSRPS